VDQALNPVTRVSGTSDASADLDGMDAVGDLAVATDVATRPAGATAHISRPLDRQDVVCQLSERLRADSETRLAGRVFSAARGHGEAHDPARTPRFHG